MVDSLWKPALENSIPETPNEFVTLLAKASGGDVDAQQQICQQYERQVMIVARVLLGPLLRPHLDSVDIMQSVHRSLLVGLRDQKFDISSPERLVGLACTMVRRKVARNWRRHRRQIRWESPAVEQDSLIQTLHSLVQTEPGPASQAEYNDQVADLYKSLSNVERAMLEKRLEGYTTGEVAEQLNMNPIAIRVRWSRLRQRLETAGIVADWL